MKRQTVKDVIVELNKQHFGALERVIDKVIASDPEVTKLSQLELLQLVRWEMLGLDK